jgi:hypothetical protein
VLEGSFRLEPVAFLSRNLDEDGDESSTVVVLEGERQGIGVGGFVFRCDHGWIAGPLSSIVAVQYGGDRPLSWGV